MDNSILHDDTALGTKKRLFLLFMFDLSDWICTLALLRTGLFREANPLMQGVISSFAAGFIVKVAMPMALILFALTKLKNADKRQIMISNNIALFGVAIYFVLNLYHIACFALLQFL